MASSSTMIWRPLLRQTRATLRAVRISHGVRCFSSSSPSSSGTNQTDRDNILKFYTHPEYTVELPANNSFPIHRYKAVSDQLEKYLGESRNCTNGTDIHPVSGSSPICAEILPTPRRASKEEIIRAHDEEFYENFENGRMSHKEMKKIGFPWNRLIVHRTKRIVGATLVAVEDVIGVGRTAGSEGAIPENQNQNGEKVWCAGNLAGGTHHAFPDRGEGFCTFNDIAVAVRHAQVLLNQKLKAEDSSSQETRKRRLLFPIIDLDVHQGNGTAHFFQNDPDVITFSLHAERNYPFKDARRTSHIEMNLKNDVSGAEYLDAVRKGLEQVDEEIGRRIGDSSGSKFNEFNGSAENLKPELLVFYQAGVDPLKEDHLGRLKLSREVLRERNDLVYEWCKKYRDRLHTEATNAAADASDSSPSLLGCVVTMGGGYSRPIDYSVEAHCDVYIQAAKHFGRRAASSQSADREKGDRSSGPGLHVQAKG